MNERLCIHPFHRGILEPDELKAIVQSVGNGGEEFAVIESSDDLCLQFTSMDQGCFHVETIVERIVYTPPGGTMNANQLLLLLQRFVDGESIGLLTENWNRAEQEKATSWMFAAIATIVVAAVLIYVSL